MLLSTTSILDSFSSRAFPFISLDQMYCTGSRLVAHCVTRGQGTHGFLLLALHTF